MTFLEAIYGSQHYELTRQGRDVSKGRFNGNIFLSVFIILLLFTISAVAVLAIDFLDAYSLHINFPSIGITGRMLGKIIGLILLGLTYFLVSITIGSNTRYHAITTAFMLYPEAEQKTATRKVLIRFFILLFILMCCMFWQIINR